MVDRARTRRRFLAAAGTGLLLGVAGCSSGPNDVATSTPTSSPSEPRSETSTATEAVSPTEEPTATTTETGAETQTETSTTTDEAGPGYKQDHWHGRLFFEVNGELVDFDRPKYYLDTLEADRPETVYFHFHEDADAHGPNEWSNEKRLITFQRALNLLPGIAYERRSGEHVITYEGTTYDGRESGTSISVKEGDERIDPTSYQVAHDDDYYVQIVSGDPKRNAEPAHEGADLGTLLFDMNNVRVDFSRERFLGPTAASEALHFHDDGHPYMWYREGPVTLAEALNALPGIEYAKESGGHVITYDDESRPAYSRTYDANRAAHDITIRQRTTPVDPPTYDLRPGDIIWVYVDSDSIPENEH